MKVWVIMGNDYPHSVEASEEAADAVVAQLRAENTRALEERRVSRVIHWRAYEFEVRT